MIPFLPIILLLILPTSNHYSFNQSESQIIISSNQTNFKSVLFQIISSLSHFELPQSQTIPKYKPSLYQNFESKQIAQNISKQMLCVTFSPSERGRKWTIQPFHYNPIFRFTLLENMAVPVVIGTNIPHLSQAGPKLAKRMGTNPRKRLTVSKLRNFWVNTFKFTDRRHVIWHISMISKRYVYANWWPISENWSFVAAKFFSFNRGFFLIEPPENRP